MLNIEVVPVTPIMQNCRLVQCATTVETVVVDPGGDVDLIIDRAAQMGAEISAIWVTHCHFDHVAGVKELATRLDIPIYGSHIADEPMLELLSPLSEQMLGVKVEGYVPDKWLSEAEQISVGAQVFDIYFTPGHCPGHIVFHHKESHTLIGGDVLFQGSIGRTDLPGCVHQDLINAIRHKLFKLPDETKVLCGHGANTTIGAERANNPFVADRLFK